VTATNSNGRAPHTNGTQTAPPVTEVVATVRNAPSVPRRVSTDYRLRGLNFDRAVTLEPPGRLANRAHPALRRRRRRLVVKWTVALIVVAALAAVLRLAVVQPYSVHTTAMVPTIQPDTGVLVVKRGSIGVGDIVVLDPPEGAACAAGADVVSRVIATGGQTIWSVGQRIYVDGAPLAEPGWYNPPFGEVGTTEIARTTVADGDLYVLGDNRTDTCDSRAFGPIDRSLVAGRVVAQITRDGHPNFHAL
jgi:signal peptidase I